MENYSKAQFESVNSELNKTNEQIDALTSKQENLLSERELLLRDAENEARILNVFHSIEGDNLFVNRENIIDDYLNSCLTEAKRRIEWWNPYIREYTEKEIDRLFNEVIVILSKEDLKGDDYDELREAVKRLRVGFYAQPSWGEKLKEISVDVKSIEESEPGFSVHGYWYGYRLNLITTNEEGHEISIRVDSILKAELGIERLTKTRRSIIKETMPHKIKLEILAYYTRGHGGGNNPNQVDSKPTSEFRVSEDDINKWVESIRGRLQV